VHGAFGGIPPVFTFQMLFKFWLYLFPKGSQGIGRAEMEVIRQLALKVRGKS
jgi:hypothetical protein